MDNLEKVREILFEVLAITGLITLISFLFMLTTAFMVMAMRMLS